MSDHKAIIAALRGGWPTTNPDCVRVSRQACEEAADALEKAEAEIEALKVARDMLDGFWDRQKSEVARLTKERAVLMEVYQLWRDGCCCNEESELDAERCALIDAKKGGAA